MSLNYSLPRFIKYSILILSAVLLWPIFSYAGSQYNLEISIGDTACYAGEVNVKIPVYLQNLTNSVAGTELYLVIDNPELAQFHSRLDTIEYSIYWIYTAWDSENPDEPIDSVIASLYWLCTQWENDNCVDSIVKLGYYECHEYVASECLDSSFVEWSELTDTFYIDTVVAAGGGFDTTGTLINNWELISTYSPHGDWQDILISAYADQIALPPDTITPGIGYPQESDRPLFNLLIDITPIDNGVPDRTITISVDPSFYDYFDHCQIYDGSMNCLDPGNINFKEGTVYIIRPICGDVDGDETTNIIDIVYMINCLYKNGPPFRSDRLADVNSDSEINILDIVAIINFLYKNGPELDCTWPE